MKVRGWIEAQPVTAYYTPNAPVIPIETHHSLQYQVGDKKIDRIPSDLNNWYCHVSSRRITQKYAFVTISSVPIAELRIGKISPLAGIFQL